MHPIFMIPAGLAAAGGVVYWIHRWRWRRHLRRLSTLHAPLQPGDPDPAWLTDFSDISAMIHMLTPGQKEQLSGLYDTGVNWRHHHDARKSLTLAEWAHRLDYAETYLDFIDSLSPAAQLAAIGVLARDLITQKRFARLTHMWAAANLIIPGGDACELITVVSERQLADGQWKPLRPAEVVKALTGESIEQLAAGAAERLKAAITVAGMWRVRAWPGVVPDLRLLSDTAPSAEVIFAGVPS